MAPFLVGHKPRVKRPLDPGGLPGQVQPADHARQRPRNRSSDYGGPGTAYTWSIDSDTLSPLLRFRARTRGTGPIGSGLARSNHEEASLLVIETLFGWVSDSRSLLTALARDAVASLRTKHAKLT